MAAAGKLTVVAIKVVTPEQMDLSRLRAENVRLKRECKILKKQRKFSLAEMCAILDVSVSGYRSWKRGGKPDRKQPHGYSNANADPIYSCRTQGDLR